MKTYIKRHSKIILFNWENWNKIDQVTYIISY